MVHRAGEMKALRVSIAAAAAIPSRVAHGRPPPNGEGLTRRSPCAARLEQIGRVAVNKLVTREGIESQGRSR